VENKALKNAMFLAAQSLETGGIVDIVHYLAQTTSLSQGLQSWKNSQNICFRPLGISQCWEEE